MFYITNSLATQSSATKWVGSLEQCEAPKQHNYYCFVWSNALERPPGFFQKPPHLTTNLPTNKSTNSYFQNFIDDV
jgi:hypothetical protein